jgi:hypothetical protein
MAETITYPANLIVTGTLRALGGFFGLTRNNISQEDLVAYPISPTDWRVWDTINTPLPAAAASDDLGVELGTFATDFPKLTAGDVKTLSSARKAITDRVRVPAEYIAGETLRLRFKAGMVTNPASASCTLDVECFKSDRAGLVSGSDRYAGAAQSINSTTLADYDFALDVTGINPGDILIVRITITYADVATGTAVKPVITAAELLCDIKG